MKARIRILAAAVALAIVPLATAQEAVMSSGSSLVVSRLASSFTPLAGSRDNAVSLVTALRTGTEVTLVTAPAGGTGDPVTTTFTPPTKPMGWGNVSHTLSLAQDSLARLGITHPTSEQLQAALLGGEVTSPDGAVTTLDGILTMRASGMGWGEIARASGTTMGSVVSATRGMQGRPIATAPATTTASGSAPQPPKRVAGITTASGMAVSSGGDRPSRGITTAAGGPSAQGRGPSKGITTASGSPPAQGSRGLVTAEGSAGAPGRPSGLTTGAVSSGGGHAYGRGLVTASGGSVGAGAATTAAHGRGAGLVSATGASVGSGATLATAAGPGNGHGQGGGNGNGRGRGG
jgi:hypothetical protein